MTRPRIKSYAEASHFLGRYPFRDTGQRGTKVVRLSATEIAVRYHNTDVVVYHHPALSATHGRVATIDNGGWTTKTTIDRINEYAPEGYGAEAHPHEGGVDVWAGNLQTGDGQWLGLGKPYVITENGGRRA